MTNETDANIETEGGTEDAESDALVGADEIREEVNAAASCVGMLWPLHSFVTANPLAGFEDRGFHEAVEAGEKVLGGRGYPAPEVLREAWEGGRIDAEVLERRLSENGYNPEMSPEELLNSIEGSEEGANPPNWWQDGWDEVNCILSKWLSAFLEQGFSEWRMPHSEQGFYDAWRTVARHDPEVPESAYEDLPDEPVEAIEGFVDGATEEGRRAVFGSQFAALPGWAALVRWRSENGGDWQSEYPITLEGYLAVRLALTEALGAPLSPEAGDWPLTADEGSSEETRPRLGGVLLEAWEETYRRELVESLSTSGTSGDGPEPDAQLVFCIDTRSEVIRRHIEAAGEYETHGYAGFFGVPMRYDGYKAEASVDSHPPILGSEHHVTETPADEDERRTHDDWRVFIKGARNLTKSLKTNAATAFTYVEKAAVGYATAMVARTLSPTAVYDALTELDRRVPDENEFCSPDLEHTDEEGVDEDELTIGIPLEDKVEYASNAFSLMGWEEFARLAVFVGHAAETANNPFDSALDCGACAANPGGPNARVLAEICNDDEVREELRERGFEIPDDTVFVAGEHNTTTDEIELFDGNVPESHADDVESLREDLSRARESAAEERSLTMGVDSDGAGGREVERRSADWAETRPEWGLAGNVSFVIGPRSLTRDLDLDARAFLHSYDPSTDPDGEALEAIMLGPMVVTQWISAQYYFASVDNSVYGSGSKVTQNPVGNVGVFQGNGGDVMAGLPLESVYADDDKPYHQPIRLSVVVYAPADRVESILDANEELAQLVDNGWVHLTVVEPGGRAVSF